MDTNEGAKRPMRRRHGQELKQQVLAECAAPGNSVAQVAMAHGLNANLVHKWRRQANAVAELPMPAFVPVTVAAPPVAEQAQFIDLELQRGAVSVRVRWPLASAAICAAWVREILR